MNRLEALALAIAHENEALEVGSEAFQTLNPGLLRSEELVRSYTSFHGGLQALLANLEGKCSGKTRANGFRIGEAASLSDLCRTFKYLQVRKIVEFLQDALDDRAINERTPLSFFLES